MLAPNVILFPVKVTFLNSNTKCETVVRLQSCLCALGPGRALAHDELCIELNDVKGHTFA